MEGFSGIDIDRRKVQFQRMHVFQHPLGDAGHADQPGLEIQFDPWRQLVRRRSIFSLPTAIWTLLFSRSKARVKGISRGGIAFAKGMSRALDPAAETVFPQRLQCFKDPVGNIEILRLCRRNRN